MFWLLCQGNRLCDDDIHIQYPSYWFLRGLLYILSCNIFYSPQNKNYYEQATTPIYISSIVLSASASANSNVSNDSSVGTNKTVSSSSGSSSFSISIKGYSKLSIQSGTCSYSLKDSSGIKSNASGTITGNNSINIYGYDLLTLSYTTSSWKESVGTHNSGSSCSSNVQITGIEIK